MLSDATQGLQANHVVALLLVVILLILFGVSVAFNGSVQF